jgi:hypothetical protein
MFGLKGVTTNEPRSASILAMTKCVFAILSETDYHELCMLGCWNAEKQEEAKKARESDMLQWSLFRGLPLASLEKFSPLLVERTYTRGEVLARQGEPLQRLIFIKHGECALTKRVYEMPAWKQKQQHALQRHVLQVPPANRREDLTTAILAQNAAIGDIEFAAGATRWDQTCTVRSDELHTYELELALQNGAAQSLKLKFLLTTADTLPLDEGFQRKLSLRAKTNQSRCNVTGRTALQGNQRDTFGPTSPAHSGGTASVFARGVLATRNSACNRAANYGKGSS